MEPGSEDLLAKSKDGVPLVRHESGAWHPRIETSGGFGEFDPVHAPISDLEAKEAFQAMTLPRRNESNPRSPLESAQLSVEIDTELGRESSYFVERLSLLERAFTDHSIDRQWKRTTASFETYLFRRLLDQEGPTYCEGRAYLDRDTIDATCLARLYEQEAAGVPLLSKLAVFSSTVAPPSHPSLVQARQDAVLELQSDRNLRSSLSSLVQGWSAYEEGVLHFLYGPANPQEIFSSFRAAASGIKQFAEDVASVPDPETPYLTALVQRLRDLRESEFTAFFEKGVTRMVTGLSPHTVGGKTVRGWKFLPWEISPKLVAFSALVGISGASVVLRPQQIWEALKKIGVSDNIAGLYGVSAFSSALLAAVTPVAAYKARAVVSCLTVQTPLQYQARNKLLVRDGLTALGRVGELLKLREDFDHHRPHSVPEITFDSHLRLGASETVGPVRADNDTFVPTNILVGRKPILVLTGPNTGGKSETVASIVHLTSKGMRGGLLPGNSSHVSVASSVRAVVPGYASLDQKGGRYETESEKGLQALLHSRKDSLLLLDEPGEGTDLDGRYAGVLRTCRYAARVGMTLVIVTHNRDLAQKLSESKEFTDHVDFQQVGFKHGEPTFQIQEGIAESSHAEAVDERTGFTDSELYRKLRSLGYVD